MPDPHKFTKRKRAIAPQHGEVGAHRYGLYRRAWERIEQAAAAGYFLEAITLIESLLADRIESRASYLTGTNVGYQTLGATIKILRDRESVPEFLAVVEQIDRWRDCRNKALHEVVKFEPGQLPTWEQKTAGLADIVYDGQQHLIAFAALDERERQANGARPPATWPYAFTLAPAQSDSPADAPSSSPRQA